MFSFSKSDKAEKKDKSLTQQIQGFAPMIKQFTGFDIDGILPIFLSGINDAKTRLGCELMLMITTTNHSFMLTVYRADQENKLMEAIFTTTFSTTFEAIDKLDEMSTFLKTFNPTANDTTSGNNGDTATSAGNGKIEPAAATTEPEGAAADTEQPAN